MAGPGRCLPWIATYLANLPMMTASDSCGARTHTWSLAVEVQFYVVFAAASVVTLGLYGRQGLAVLCGAGVVMSLAVRAVHAGDVARFYFGSDTNAYALLTGACLACFAGVGRPLGQWLWVAAAGAVVPLCVPGSSVAAPVVASTLVALLVRDIALGSSPRAISARWIALVGQRSYGLYLWHVPVTYFAWSLAGRGWPMVPTMLGAVGLGCRAGVVAVRRGPPLARRWNERTCRPAKFSAREQVGGVGRAVDAAPLLVRVRSPGGWPGQVNQHGS